MERVHLHMVPIDIEDESLEIVLTLSHGKKVFPEEGRITLEMNLEMWAGALLDYAEYHLPNALLSYDALPDTKIVRRDDGGHTMLWLAFEHHEEGSSTPYWYSVDLDFDDFVRQVRDALVVLGSDPARNQLRFRGHSHERAIAALGAVLGENDPPPPSEHMLNLPNEPRAYNSSKLLKVARTTLRDENNPPPAIVYTIHMHYRPQAPGPSRLQLVIDWDTLAADPNMPSELSLMLHVASDVESKVFPVNAAYSNTASLLSTVTNLFYYWTLSDKFSVIRVKANTLWLERDHDARQHVASFTWWGPVSEAPPSPYIQVGGVDRDNIVHNTRYNQPNVDALDFTRQVIDAARTLLRLLDEHGQVSQHTLSARRMLPELERIVALVQASTPPGNA